MQSHLEAALLAQGSNNDASIRSENDEQFEENEDIDEYIDEVLLNFN